MYSKPGYTWNTSSYSVVICVGTLRHSWPHNKRGEVGGGVEWWGTHLPWAKSKLRAVQSMLQNPHARDTVVGPTKCSALLPAGNYLICLIGTLTAARFPNRACFSRFCSLPFSRPSCRPLNQQPCFFPNRLEVELYIQFLVFSRSLLMRRLQRCASPQE